MTEPTWIENVILRKRARRDWPCWGDGARRAAHADGCAGTITAGTAYAEYIGETPAYQSGSRHSMPCALAYLTTLREKPA
jgi:hypothetical protein